ncbi:MAG: class I SAM-dependent methyltransferase [Salinivirgaceae bacterium]
MIKNKGVRDYYNKYVERQQRIGVNARHHSIMQKLIDAGLLKHHKVLEIGCGIGTQSGLILKYLSPTGALISYDLSEKSIEIAQKKYSKHKNVQFICADLTEYNIEGAFDVIVLPDVIEHIPLEKHPILFDKLRKVLKLDGFMFIHIPFPFYQDWLHKNRPELLQIIDQPVHLSLLSDNLTQSGFFIQELKNYSVFTKPYDYQYIVCKPLHILNDFVDIKQKITFWDKVKYKIRRLGQKQ